MRLPPIIQVGNVLLSSEILTEKFCCDLNTCKGECCVEGDAGAPVTLDEVGEIENCLDAVWPHLSASAQTVIDRQGVAYTDAEADLVTSIVNGKDCVFTYYDEIEDRSTRQPIPHCCLCALEKVFREGRTRFCKPVSCALYPIREKRMGDDLVGLNYNRWSVCRMAVAKGVREQVPLYGFLREPLVRRFGEAWYQELLDVVEELKRQGCL